MSDETTIDSAITGRSAYNVTTSDGKTYILDAVTGNPVFIINGEIGGGGTAKAMTTEEREAYTPAEGEMIFDTDEGALYVGDGFTPGGIPVGSGGGGSGGTPATVKDIMTGSGAAKILNVSNIRGALTAGQAVDVTSEPDSFSTYATGGGYRDTFTWSYATLGFASFPKYANGLNYIMLADLTATSGGNVTPSGTWLDGTTSAKSLTAGSSVRVAMLFNAANKAKFTFAGTGVVSVSHLREYEVTACTPEAIAYIAALSGADLEKADVSQDFYLVKRDMVSPWIKIINMPDATVNKPGFVTFAAGLAYQLKAMAGTYTFMVDTCPQGYVGRDTFVRIFVGQTGNIIVQTPLQLASPLIANAINNCRISYRDGSAVLTVDDTVGGYIVESATGMGSGTLYYGLMDSATEFISIPGTFDGVMVDIGGASVVTSGTAQKYVVGNGTYKTVLSGTLTANPRLQFGNLALADVGIMGGTLTILDGVQVASGTTVVSSGASVIFNGGGVGSDGILRVSSGGGLAIERASGGGVIDLGGTNVPIDTRVELTGCTIANGSGAVGGAFYTSDSIVGALVLSSAVLTGNSATNGGAIYLRSAGASAELADCLVSGNSASYGGGFAVSSGASVKLVSTTVSGNSIQDFLVGSSASVVLSGGCTVGTLLFNTSGGSVTLHGSNVLSSAGPRNASAIGFIEIGDNATLNLSGVSVVSAIRPAGTITFGSNVTVINSGGTSVLLNGGTASSCSIIMNDGTIS